MSCAGMVRVIEDLAGDWRQLDERIEVPGPMARGLLATDQIAANRF